MRGQRPTLLLAAVFAGFALVTLGIWIPADVETGVVETFRRQTNIGDAMAPTVVAVGMLIASVALAVSTLLRPGAIPAGIDGQSIRLMLSLAAVLALGLLLMVQTGPVLVGLINGIGGDIGSYRELRDTVPYKYVGYLLGGTVLVAGIIAVVERRLSGRRLLIGALTAVVLAMLYDLPFDDLLLPPNGDQ